MIAKKHKDEENKYSFTPFTDHNLTWSGPCNSTRYMTLYKDHHERQERQKIRSINYYKSFSKVRNKRQVNKSVSFCIKNNNNLLNLSNHFEKLYLDSSTINKKKLKLTKDLYSNYTFSPKTNKNINIKSTFIERNNKCIHSKNLIFEKYKDNNRKSKSPKLSKQQIEEHNKNIVERLYTKEMEKLKERSQEKNEISDKEKKQVVSKTNENQNNKRLNKEQSIDFSKKNQEEDIVHYDSNLRLEEVLKRKHSISIKDSMSSENQISSRRSLKDRYSFISDKIPVKEEIKTPTAITNNFRSKALLEILKERKEKI
jgi:hypothetical protein